MFNKLTVTFNDTLINCMLLDGFYDLSAPSKVFHKHNYTEIHIIANGPAHYQVNNEKFVLNVDNTLIVPADHWHNIVQYDDTIRHVAFCVDYAVTDTSVHSLDSSLIDLFFDAIQKCKNTDNYCEVTAYISIILCEIFPNMKISAKPIIEPAFIIDYFLSHNYNRPVTLNELAHKLHLSEKQTGRLVYKHTGLPFKQAVISYRMSVAKQLQKTTNMSLAEIAEAVGYDSYNGFLKIYKSWL